MCESCQKWTDLRLETTTGQNKTPYCRKLLHNFQGAKYIIIFSGNGTHICDFGQIVAISSKMLNTLEAQHNFQVAHLWQEKRAQGLSGSFAHGEVSQTPSYGVQHLICKNTLFLDRLVVVDMP